MPDIEEEMEVIHHRSQLVVARNNIVRTAISNPSVIDVVQYSPNEISVIGLDMGSTTLTIWFENRRDPLIYLVNVIRDPSLEERRRVDYGKLERKLGILFPNSKVYLIPLSGKIVVKGQARDVEEASRILQIVRGEVINQEGSLMGPQPDLLPGAYRDPGAVGDLTSQLIVNMLEVPGEFQVMLRVRIAELNRSQLRRMGVDMSYLINSGRHLISASMGGIPSTLTGIFENGEIEVLINWLASNGTAKILAEPTLTVLSGHAASFLSGGEFAVPTIVGVGGAQGTTTTFRGFGTSLIVTPTIVDRDLVRLRIVPEFSQINADNAVQGIPGVDSRRVQTTVELREGQTVAIAGLLSRQTNTEVTRIPFLGDIPVIGPRLFSTKVSTEDQSELLILVTPELVRPMDPDEVPPVPGFNVTHPTDHDLYFQARTEGNPDNEIYQLAPYGHGVGHGVPVGYRLFNPTPADPLYGPAPTGGPAQGPPPNFHDSYANPRDVPGPGSSPHDQYDRSPVPHHTRPTHPNQGPYPPPNSQPYRPGRQQAPPPQPLGPSASQQHDSGQTAQRGTWFSNVFRSRRQPADSRVVTPIDHQTQRDTRQHADDFGHPQRRIFNLQRSSRNHSRPIDLTE